MPQKRRSKTLEELEREIIHFGLTRQAAAAIVRLANNLKQSRKLRAAHILLLTPGRRLHPPSPLGQPVWNQSEIALVGEIGGSVHQVNMPGAAFASLNVAHCSQATTATNALNDAILSGIDAVAVSDVASIVDGLSISQGPPASMSEFSTDASPAGAEEEMNDDEVGHHGDDGTKADNSNMW